MTGDDVSDEVRSLNEASNSARKYKFEEVEASSDGERVSGLSNIFAWSADLRRRGWIHGLWRGVQPEDR